LIDDIIGSGNENMRPLAFVFTGEFLGYVLDANDYLSRRKYINSKLFTYVF
jgi:hypothetical protein